MSPAERVDRILAEAVGSDHRPCVKCSTLFSGKRCPACRREYERARIAANPEKKKKYDPIRYAANREKEIAKSTAYNNAHQEQRKAYNSAYYQKNRETELARMKRWAESNKQRVVESRAAWRRANLEYTREKCRMYRKEKPEAKRLSEQKRRARARNASGVLSKDIMVRLYRLQRGKCACCGLPLGNRYELDHVFPLAKGGQHADRNMQLLRKKCNQEKSAKHPVDFMQSRGFLL